MKDWLSIGEFSKQAGFSNKALRVYEEKGLLVPHARSESQYRFYTQAQLEIAKKIQVYKGLGFSLDEIKNILSVTSESSLKELVQNRLQEARVLVRTAQSQVFALESILTSLEQGQTLTTQQRRDVMENILETSVANMKRRGILPADNDVALLSNELETMSEELRSILPDFREILRFAKNNNLMLGPGRGSTSASIFLFSEGYAPIYPTKYGLLPEFFSRAKHIWLDVEYSRSEQIGVLCDALTKKSAIEVIAFRSPVLDIFRDLQQSHGPVDFDKFSDTDPLILEAPKRLGVEGLWDFDWNPDFDAYRRMTPEKQQEHALDTDFFLDWISQNPIQSAEDFMNISYLYFFEGNKGLAEYSASRDKITPWPELKNSRGMLIYREDWIRIFANRTGISINEAYLVHRVVADAKENELAAKINLVSDPATRNLLIARASKVFMKSHMVTSWWQYKRTAIAKSLWGSKFLAAINSWEQKNGMIWQEFGYRRNDGTWHLKA